MTLSFAILGKRYFPPPLGIFETNFLGAELIRIIGVIVLRMPLKPSDILLILIMGRVLQDFYKAVITRNTATVFRWAGSLPGYAFRVFSAFGFEKNCFK